MRITRRHLAALLPALSAQAQDKKAGGSREAELHSAGYDFASLPERVSANGKMKSRSVFHGVTTRGQRLTMHISELAPGEAPHPPQRQPHEEVIVIREGTLEATLNGKVVRLGPGSCTPDRDVPQLRARTAALVPDRSSTSADKAA